MVSPYPFQVVSILIHMFGTTVSLAEKIAIVWADEIMLNEVYYILLDSFSLFMDFD